MNEQVNFGQIVKERRLALGLTQAELGQRVGCAPITVRKIEAAALRPSVQIAERLAVCIGVPEEQRAALVRLARAEREVSPIPLPPLVREEIGQEDLTGRAIRGYALAERIGAGGFGVVYHATQATIERKVAVKIILPGFADQPDFIRRFEAEAQLIAQIEHPHIVPLYDYWREPGAAYLVMRLLRGGSLADQLQHGPLTPAFILQILEQIGVALHMAHRAGVVHRDIKPANILLDEQRNAYLADFGIAKRVGMMLKTGVTAEGALVGSPPYIAPEQILADAVQPQTDVYSLGVVLYELLTGQKPFTGPTPAAYIQQHLNQPLPLLAAARSVGGQTVSLAAAPLDQVLAQATAKQTQNRYPDVLSFLADLRRALTPTVALEPAAAVLNKSPFATVEIELPDLTNPYKGLRPFTEVDAADFFGREVLTQDLLTRLGESDDLARFLAVVGPSGSGKSSVVRAGLIPALRKGGLPGSERWFITELLPGAHPFEELTTALLRVAVGPHGAPHELLLLNDLRAGPSGLQRVVAQILPPDPQVELALVIDQFEELFTLVEDEVTRAQFLDALVVATLDPESRLRLLITLRADFMDQPLHYTDFGELLRQRTEFVLPLTPDDLEQAIVRPTERVGLRLEKGLAATIIREIGDQPGMLPLLQHALTELFEQRADRILTLAAYRAIGGVSGALARRADEIYAGLDAAGQSDAHQLFLRLVTPGEGVEDTRRRVLRAELETLAGGAISQVIDLFGRYRLLTFDRDPLSRGPTVEVAHEALLREWGRLRQWLAAARADIRQQRLLASAAAEWVAAECDGSFLLRDARLEQFVGWVTASRVALTAEEQAFLDTSAATHAARVAAEEARRSRELATARQLAETESRRAAENARSAGRLRRFAYGLAGLLALVIGLAILVFAQRNIAQRNFERAEQVRLAAQAQIALDNGEGGNLPALLALRSLRYGYTPEADAALLIALSRGFARQIYLGHTGQLGAVAMSPDGLTAVTSSADHTARLWDARTGEELRRFVHDGPLNNVVFSSDGRFILTDSFDNTVRVWDAASGQELQRIPREHSGSYGAEFSPDGSLIVFGDGPMAVLWDVAERREIRRFTGHTDTVYWTEFSPDGLYGLTASGDNTARIWDIASGTELRRFVGHIDNVYGVGLSADGRHMLTSSADGTARLWDVASGAEIQRYVGHTNLVYEAVFSPDGTTILTSSEDKTARLWDVASGRELRQFIGHTGGVLPSSFSPNGEYVLTGSTDRTARLWDVDTITEPRRFKPEFRNHVANLLAARLSANGRSLLTAGQSTLVQWDVASGETAHEHRLLMTGVNAEAISPDGRIMISAHGNGLVKVWEVESGAELRQFAGHSGQVWNVAFSADGRQAITGGADGSARLWDVASGQELQRLKNEGPVRSVTLSPDARFALTGGADGSARLWDVASGRELRVLAGHAGIVQAVAFAPNGGVALTGGDDGLARLWDVASGQELRVLAGHSAEVTVAAFSPDGRLVITGGGDQTARIWEVAGGAIVRQLVGHTSPLTAVGFSADGQQVISADSQAAYLWRANLEDLIAYACAQLAADLSVAERARYEIKDDRPTCARLGANDQVAEAAWTAAPLRTAVAMAPIGTPAPQVIAMEFVNESINIGMGMPIGDVYIDASNGQVVRPRDLNPETLAQPLFTTAVEALLPLQPPGDAGPFPKGKPLGVTLEEWFSASGHGTYTVQHGEATVEMNFDKLMPNGVYTLWCVEMHVPPAEPAMFEHPCGAPDGSENSFTADENGHAAVTIVIDAFPPPTAEVFYSIVAAYHSDGLTHGASVGQHGLNAHAHIFYDFLAPTP